MIIETSSQEGSVRRRAAMQHFRKHTGLVAPFDRVNVDTDQMVPKEFCKLLTREGYGRFLFYDWRYFEGDAPNPAFVLNQPRYRGASVLLTRANFGCGSSREHGPGPCSITASAPSSRRATRTSSTTT